MRESERENCEKGRKTEQEERRMPQRKKHYTSHNGDFVILQKIKQAKTGALASVGTRATRKMAARLGEGREVDRFRFSAEKQVRRISVSSSSGDKKYQRLRFSHRMEQRAARLGLQIYVGLLRLTNSALSIEFLTALLSRYIQIH